MQVREIADLVRLEFRLDRRQKHALGGLLLYVVAAIYICYLSFRQLHDIDIWNALYWIILLFAAFNALARSFQREDKGRQLYLYTLARPSSVIVARTLYNMLLLVLLALLSLGCYVLFLGSGAMHEAHTAQFLLVVVLGSIGLASVLTMISALAGRAGSGLGLMAILGFPVVLPVLLIIIRASSNALKGIDWSVNSKYFLWLLLVDVMVISLSYILFPYLWRD
jgi:heme exporter protein B